MRCPNCGSPESVVKVWESVVLHDAGMPAKFVGCEKCGEMNRKS